MITNIGMIILKGGYGGAAAAVLNGSNNSKGVSASPDIPEFLLWSIMLSCGALLIACIYHHLKERIK